MLKSEFLGQVSKPVLHAVRAGCLNHWTTREAPSCSYFIGKKRRLRKEVLEAKQPEVRGSGNPMSLFTVPKLIPSDWCFSHIL